MYRILEVTDANNANYLNINSSLAFWLLVLVLGVIVLFFEHWIPPLLKKIKKRNKNPHFKEVFIKNALKKSFEELDDEKYRQAVYKIYDEVLKGQLEMYPNLLNYVPKIDVEVVGDPKDKVLKVSIVKPEES